MIAALYFPNNKSISHFVKGCDFTKINAMIGSYGPQSPGIDSSVRDEPKQLQGCVCQNEISCFMTWTLHSHGGRPTPEVTLQRAPNKVVKPHSLTFTP